MATYKELFDLATSGGADTKALLEKIEVALTVKAVAFLSGTPTAAAATWAKDCLANPGSYSLAALRALLAQNKALTIAQITGVSEAALQTGVDNLIDKIYAS